MEKIADQYPDAAPHLEVLPEHAAQHIGSAALRLTHEDMHPKKEVPGEYGGTELVTDFSQVITDPEYDSSQLADDAVEAAHAGKRELSAVMLASSEMLHSSHDKLSEQGFGPTGLETDEQKDIREHAERDAIYDAACEHALEVASTARDKNDHEGAVIALESVILLRFLKGDDSRKMLRTAVRDDLSEELLQATQMTNKLFTGHRYERVSDSMNGARNLLGMATGKKLDGHFTASGDVNLFNIQPLGGEELKDTMAVMTSPNGWLTPGKAYGAFGSSTQIMNIKERLKPELPADAVGSAEYFYQLVEESAEPEILSEIFKCTDPRQALKAARTLDIAPHQVATLFGQAENWGDLEHLDTEVISQMAELKQAHPKHFEKLVNSPFARNKIKYKPAEITKGLDALAKAGIDKPDFTEFMTIYPEDIDTVVDGCISLTKSFAELGVGIEQLTDVVKRANGPALGYLLDYAYEKRGDISELALQVVSRAEIGDAYRKLYADIKYPFTGQVQAPELDELPHMRKRMLKLGLPEDVAGAMFKSWATYDEFAKNYYDDETFNMPQEAPDQDTLEKIAKGQIDALQKQMEELEGFVTEHGIDTARSIISTFGIYNFARYDPKMLIEQDKSWHAGEKVQSVVVDARNDWNSFTKGRTKFEEEVGQGVFYFEANSGYEAARIAVRVGQHERASGREPDVRRFVIHAHGNPQTMIMGVDGEAIDTRGYQEAARKAARINAKEINDYRKHLGRNFKIILQSCSTAGDMEGDENIAEIMNKRHDAEVQASDVTINNLMIQNDGTVKFSTSEGEGVPVTYSVQ